MLRREAGDGHCAIDIIPKMGVISDISTGEELSRAASIVLDLCVKGYNHLGGIAVDVGEQGC